MTTYTRCKQTNLVRFYRNGQRVYDFTISGNIVEFSNGDIIKL